MLHSHLQDIVSTALVREQFTLTFSGIMGVNVAGYEIEFELLRDIAGLRPNRLSKGGSAPTASPASLPTDISIMTVRFASQAERVTRA